MSYRLKLDAQGSKELSLEIIGASVTEYDYFLQCWCIKLKVNWQTMSIDGWAFLSAIWGELLFQRDHDGQPPHFISGKPVETGSCNDMLWGFADDIGFDPQEIAASIFKVLNKITFVMPPVRAVSGEININSAMGYRYEDNVTELI